MSDVMIAVALVALQRAAELVLARRNTRALREAGGVEYGAGHYPLIVALHASWLIALPLAVPAGAEPDGILIALYLALQPLRYWAIAALGRRWTTRVIVVPGAAPVRAGPYRFLRHPNYLAVALEIPLLPLAFGAWEIAAVFGMLNFALLAIRIRAEDEALSTESARRDVYARGTGASAPLDRKGARG
ncbi:MAG TPA: isoprenylcysteine carboxylmethyltransferase family protein [Alphaproteobacteria bacterium]